MKFLCCKKYKLTKSIWSGMGARLLFSNLCLWVGLGRHSLVNHAPYRYPRACCARSLGCCAEKMEFGRRLCGSFWRWISCDSLLFPAVLSPGGHTNSTLINQTSSHVPCISSLKLLCTRALSISAKPQATPTLHRGHRKFLDDKNSSFDKSQEPRQFISGSDDTIVCVHPTQPTPLADTRPLRAVSQSVKELRDSLTPDEIKTVRRLRSMDGALWTVNTLARHFNVKRKVISQVAPASLERQKELDEEKAKMAAMKPYKRKLYKTQKQMERQKRLEELVSKNREALSKPN